MNKFDLDRGMGIRGLTGSKPPSFQYQNDPIRDAIASRQDANDSMNRATDQYEADVADFKDTIAREKEQGIAGLPQIDDMINMPPPMENKPRYIAELPPPVFDDNPFKDIFKPPFTPPMDDPIFVPPIDEPPFVPPFKPPFTPPIDEPPFTPPFTPPFEPPYDDRINEDPPYVPPNDPPINDLITTPPPPPPSGPSGPINYYTGKPINNPYIPYATDSGATPLTRKITPRTFAQAPGFEITRGPSLKKPPIPPKRNDQIFVPPPDDLPKRVNMGGSLTNGIMRLPQSQQGDTMTTQMFQRAFRPRR